MFFLIIWDFYFVFHFGTNISGPKNDSFELLCSFQQEETQSKMTTRHTEKYRLVCIQMTYLDVCA